MLFDDWSESSGGSGDAAAERGVPFLFFFGERLGIPFEVLPSLPLPVPRTRAFAHLTCAIRFRAGTEAATRSERTG